jgi:soluble lytic murein transglycosylase
LRLAPDALKGDPLYLYAETMVARRADKPIDAARALAAAPRDPTLLVDPDAWWKLRRWTIRKLLDAGDSKTAYELCLDTPPGSAETNLDVAFHCGWIALRFLLNYPAAETHFRRLAALATTPVSKARAGYWLGRTDAAAGRPARAAEDYRAAAAYGVTYYGQLAQAALGGGPPAIGAPVAAQGMARDEAVRAVEFLGAHGAPDLARSLALQAAYQLSDPGQLEALAAVGESQGDARETLEVGKIAERRGIALDDAAFPIFGIPAYPSLASFAPKEIVYSIARQESAFRSNALSTAGARGLMQMILSTARRTAQLLRVPFDARRLSRDASYNAELGAAHLGELLREQRGSLLLTFAAYNAGGHRVREWTDAYGDPRRPNVDWVDWVERIPIAETRDYVQRVLENYNVYKARFADPVLKATAAPPAPAPAPVKPFPLTPADAPPSAIPSLTPGGATQTAQAKP